MKQLSVAAALAAACLVVPGAVGAQSDLAPAIAAHQPVTLAGWSRLVNIELNHQLQRPIPVFGGDIASGGVVRVKFNCSESGRPDKATVIKSSGNLSLDMAALYAVRRIVTLHPLPDGMRHDQKYAAMIVFSSDTGAAYERRLKQIGDAATKNNTWFKGRETAGNEDRVIELAGR